VSEPKLHDKFGQLRIAKLRQSFPRVKDVEAIAEKRHFIHWQLTFADVFAHRGGFDLVLGNPPWLKVEWNEAGILGEVCGGPGCSDSFRRFLSGGSVFRFRLPGVLADG
jgi:hypothetical protein